MNYFNNYFLNNENKFGKEKWAEMEHERLENLWKVGANLRSLVIEGKTKDKPPFNPIYAKEDPISYTIRSFL